MNRIELENGSVIEFIKSDSNIRSKRGQEQLDNMKSAWEFIDEYYNDLTWYRKIITKIRWSFDDFFGFFIRLYYKTIIKMLYKK
jgi:hypothetical protein